MISAFVMKLENSLAILFVSVLVCSILAYNASHLWNVNRPWYL